MKDFTPVQKLLMAFALLVAVSFAVAMGVPKQSDAGANATASMATPF